MAKIDMSRFKIDTTEKPKKEMIVYEHKDGQRIKREVFTADFNGIADSMVALKKYLPDGYDELKVSYGIIWIGNDPATAIKYDGEVVASIDMFKPKSVWKRS